MADSTLRIDPSLPLPWLVTVPPARRPDLLVANKRYDTFGKLESWAFRNKTAIGVHEGSPPKVIGFLSRELAEKFIKEYRL
ncbi:hypothetical protein FF100_22115 [Methylobacterium terricola]|uniref:Uncharacterized protein n=1 Tax=Methylobacterium terricola TaxID=2583531 RepID=A0A5C4LE49_9HYPH|nr:hypothetical protein [Methylobacterium terricola]TNC10849.1 hypothetical protein FF100_22115 [Methylobacterium terricola]